MGEGGTVLINLWYVAEWCDKVGKDPVRVKLLGQQFVLFRDQAWNVKDDSIVATFRNPELPLDTLRVAIPFLPGYYFSVKEAVYFDNSCIFTVTPPDVDRSLVPIPKVERFYLNCTFSNTMQ